MSHATVLRRLIGVTAFQSTSAHGRMRVLVVGGGFAGGLAAVRLAGRARGHVDVTVVNPRLDFVNRVRMHQVAVGRPAPFPSLPVMLGAGVGFLEGWVTAIDPQAGRAEISGPDG